MNPCARLFALVVLLLATSARADVDWTVLSSDPSGLRLRIEVTGAALAPRQEGLSSVLLPGAHRAGDPGYPALPADARWVAIPPGARPRVSVTGLRVEELGVGRLVPVPVPAVMDGLDEEPRLVERLQFAEDYDSFRSSESEVVLLSDPVQQRRQHMVSIGLQPVLYDASTGRVRVVTELECSISWAEPAITPDAPAAPDQAVLRTVLNPEQARTWSTWSARQRMLLESSGSRPVWPRSATAGIDFLDPLALAADGIRLRVEHSGIVRVSIADLAAAAGLPLDVPRSWLRVVQMRGSEPGEAGYPSPLAVDVPLHFFGRPDESQNLGSGDEIYFHALRVEDDADTLEVDGRRALPALPWGESRTTDAVPPRYAGDHFNSANVYWVYVMPPPAGGWSRMAPVTLAPSGGNPAAQYQRVEHFEGNQGLRDEPYDIWVERYAWNRLDEMDVTRVLELASPVPGGDLRVRWAAAHHITGSAYPIRFSLRQEGVEQELNTLNLTTVGIMTEWSRTVVASPFRNGLIDFRMQRQLNGTDIAVNSFLDHVELEYPALFVASGNELRFLTGSVGGTADVEVEGYTRSDLLCFDVTDPRAPEWIDLGASNVIDRSGGGPANFALSLQVPQATGQERAFTASPRAFYPRIRGDDIERDSVADLFSTLADVQVIAVGPEAFRAQAERWIAWREQTYADAGWDFAYVDVQQIYDEFSGGLQSPWAIRDFAEWAWVQWDAVALILFGDASEDPLNASGRAGASQVPASLHLQSFSGIRELLASDKWYGIFGYTEPGAGEYPSNLDVTSDLLVGRFPVGGVSELASMIDKIIAYEQSDPDAAWKRRTLWVSDDAYSTDLIGAGSGCYSARTIEDEFRISQLASAEMTSASLDSTVTGELLNADTYTADCRTGVECENLGSVRQCYLAEPYRRFIDRWSEGWLWLSYQGHAAYNVLGHENLFLSRQTGLLGNHGRPWVFFGMGCHVSDFIRFEEDLDGRSIGEMVLTHPTAGAIATYGSSGFEFLTPNATFMEILGETMFDHRVAQSPVFGTGLRNQWILGDVLVRSELETLAMRLALGIYKADEMIAQYNLLGDPLLKMDAGAPRMEVSRGGAPVIGGGTIEADPESNAATIDLVVVDETGLDRVEITDSSGRDYGGVVPPLGGSDPRQASFSVDLPVYPQAYSVEIASFDAARADLRQTVLTLNVELPVDFLVDGEPVAPGSSVALQEDVPRAMQIEFTSPVDLVEADIQIEYPGVDLLSIDRTGSGRAWSLAFDVLLQSGAEPGALDLVLRGERTTLVTTGTAPGGDEPVVLRHAVFPNPMQDLGRIVVQVEGAVDQARLSVYDVAGNEVSSSVLSPSALAPHEQRGTSIAFEFQARDRRGDELANGTYFYRISVDGPAGSARSDMGRVVIMR